MWTQEKVEQLIGLYEDRPCLYNTTLKEYHNRDARKKTIEELATILEVSGVCTIRVQTLTLVPFYVCMPP